MESSVTDFFNTLMTATEQERNELQQIETLQKGSAGDISLQTYQAFLTEAYHHVKHTTPLLMACGSRIPQDKEWLRNALAEYIEEELGHQEWILNDITATGMNAEHVRFGQASQATELMVAYAYDLIMRINPIGFFGMVLVLEGTSIALATNAAGNIQEKLSLPDSAFSYLTSHGSLDIEHMSFYESLMNKITDEEDQNVIIHAAKMFYKLYGDIFRSIPI
ncbi:MAG: iron-containing redox enzyme family protein [gamma proteobacterium symbiont of Bathyaustriella thionipta]|nr:iron-containing redox enzyme family protein [gamma proteobacterium symbiont of Bathyaustriella thionipta]MCU7950535.1 iron-containing redox enzyme family protein [gamma proteobacterium symbiont of Bathyaustriella thionipta]MCU7951849.1 iron-containing redox enzyme family protein [gamma proteobacterium symbiont of Bathyaustriella thionipta]MCU7957029.1 iron-containing redox enzyme family protein [gamma proteobacterium symbiont of Bathyaustriella thionipta]MCU7968857.1 iron-containing redox en